MLLEVVKQIVAKEGEQILSEPKRVNAFFSDLAKDEPKPQKKAIINRLEYGVVKILKDVTKEKRANCKESLAQRLRTEEGLDIEFYREAIAILCEVLFDNDKSEETYETYAERGKACLEKGQYDEAIIDFTEAIKFNPKDDISYANRGEAYRMKGQYDEAIIDFTEAIKLDPEYTWAYNSRGEAYQEKGQYDEAIRDFTEAIRLDPEDDIAYANRGKAYLEKNQYDEAIRNFTEAIRLDPEYAFAYTWRGEAYRKKCQYDEAIRDFIEAIRLAPKYVFAYTWCGDAYREKGQYDEAIVFSTVAIRLNPEYVFAYVIRGDTYRQKCQYDEAIIDFTEAIRLDSKYALAYATRGEAYRMKGQHDEAIIDLTKAIELDSKYVWTYGLRGLAYKQLGNRNQAIQDFEKALTLDPNLDWVKKELKEIQEMVQLESYTPNLARRSDIERKTKECPFCGEMILAVAVKCKHCQSIINEFTDPRDGKIYRTVKIGNQVWMAENLNFDCPGSKCYDNDPKNANIYGRLYDWETAKKACPPGWHLPSNEEWQALVDFAGGGEIARKKLKAKNGWNRNGNGTDEFNFSVLPGGYGYIQKFGNFFSNNVNYRNIGYLGFWWNSSTEDVGFDAYARSMDSILGDVRSENRYINSKSFLFSVRYLLN